MAEVPDWRDRVAQTAVDFEETAIDQWVLTLAIREETRLLAVLSNGRWLCTVGDATWPPQHLPALPSVVLAALASLADARLSIQLPFALDDWPWEDEIDVAVVRRRPIARQLTDLPEMRLGSAVFSRLVVWEGGLEDCAAAIRTARALARPIVVAHSDMPASKRPLFENLLRSHWRHPLLLSQSLERSLRMLELPLGSCRLYGDARGLVDDAEEGWRPVTAVSIDLVGSTPLLNAKKGEEYGETMTAYYRLCQEITLRFYGTLDSPQGDDGLMAYFGFPRAVEGAASRALTAAWHLSRELSERGLPVRIGVASGEVAVNARLAYGPDVHLAARLRERARPGQVLVAPSTLLRATAGFRLELHAADQTLDGFDHPMSVYALEGLPAHRPREDAAPTHSTRFVGRRAELARLQQVWEASAAGKIRWCIVRGEPGVGKSRLLEEFTRVVRREGSFCHRITGRALADRSPFAAIVDGLRQLWRIVPGTSAAALAEQLTRLLPLREAGDPSIDELVCLLLPSPPASAAAEPETRWRSTELLLDCLTAVLAAGRGCLLVDDAQWLDPSSVELLGRLHGLHMPRALLILVGERSDAAPVLSVPDADVVDLHGLSNNEAAELARELGAQLPSWARQRVVERAGGVPLFVEESIRMLRERGVAAVDELPAKLEDLLVARLDELGLDRAFAQLVSVLGRECLAIHLEMLLQQDDPFVVAARSQGSLEFLLASGLLQYLDGPRPGYRFRHGLLRDAAYRSMRSRDRQRLHGLCASLLEQVTPEIRRERPEMLAAHLQAAGRIAEARDSWFDAARLAAARHAHRETVALSRRALEWVDTIDDAGARGRRAMSLHLLVASAQIALHGYGSREVEEAYLLAEKSASGGADAARRLRVRLGLEACHVMRGNLERAGNFAQEAIATADVLRDARLALQARWALANVQFHRGRWRVSLAGFDDCIARYHRGLHQRSSVQDPAIMCLGYSSWTCFELGWANEALRRIDQMLALARQLDHPFSMGVTLAFAASIKRLCGLSDEAWPHAVEAVEVCERGGFEVWLAHAWMVRGQLLSDRGDAKRGAEDMDRGYALWTAGGARISCATYRVTRAEILLRQGATAQAEHELASAAQLSRDIRESYYLAELQRLQGLCAWQSGDLPRAETTLRRALTVARRHGKKGLGLRCALSLGALEAATNRPFEAARRFRGLLDGLTDHDRSRDFRWARGALSSWEAGRPFSASRTVPWEPA